ncbi:MAG: class I SAM-dependent methyltransferase, partial [Cellulosilyticaceae bacterium]
RFKARELNVMIHEECLQDDIRYFPKTGKVLDIACGDGRNAIYLARLGYEVVAIDFCEEALERLKYFAQKEHLKIETRLIDLSKDYSFLDKFEAIIINHYRLKPRLYSHLMNYVRKDGVLWVNGFSEVPEDHPNITEVDILKESDFIGLDNYILENKSIYQINQQKFIRCIWRK